MKTLDAIAAELQGYDPQALPAATVGAFLHALVEPLTEVESLALPQALDRVLAQDVISPISVPPHDNAAMDGYAVHGEALRTDGDTVLRVLGTCLAGQARWRTPVPPDACVRVMTGAVMPEGLDTVVPVEFVQPVPGPATASVAAGAAPQTTANGATEFIRIPPGVVRPGDHRRLCGEDLMAGQPALLAGQRLGPAALGLLASLGIAEIPVVRRPRVAYFSTGDEILSLGQALRPGAVFDSNRYTVTGLLRRLGADVIDMGVVPDDPAALEQAFREAARLADAVITSGGVSMGEADHTKAMMRRLGEVVFWRIAMRPGRPMAVGRLHVPGRDRPTLLFGLPGNPVAVMVTFVAFVRPALLRLMGARHTEALLMRARSAEVMRKKPGRTEYQRGIVSRDADGTPWVRTTGNQGSGVLRSMVEANALIVLGHTQGSVAVGQEVDVMLFDGVI
ncbi:molybdopterin molybdotransferase MoeA [Tepidimonas charontis]|uniref:Molybdopterin molybdenumtransferase n=1 Tax=Tepidimonas charontis TaxID=2267262 RepID=A0A554XKS2_9BURK|nr:gephyrin-like molybdotransferase Glp [Tepidimonas charontis]TSE36435.1 Molybdopterin molybdenumtransferase [Tepidimonas charontis]